MTLEELNHLPVLEAQEEFMKCCGSTNWAKKVTSKRPFSTQKELLIYADKAWVGCNEQDGLEAFSHHPKIGDLKQLEKKFPNTSQWSGNEQKSIKTASKEILESLAQLNAEYENKFGFIFIVCATGKSAWEMLELLKARSSNARDTEIRIAMEEQGKITQIRLNELLS